MINLLINPDEEFTINFVVAQDKRGKIYIDNNLSDLKQMLSTIGIEYEIEEHSAIFKKPNFKDIVDMTETIYGSAEGNIGINPIKNRYRKVIKLIKSWTIKDEQGKTVEAEEINIDKLNPVVAQFIIDLVDAETGGIMGIS